MDQFVKHFFFVFMVLTPLFAPTIFFFFIGWLFPKSKLSKKYLLLWLVLLGLVLILIALAFPKLLVVSVLASPFLILGLYRPTNFNRRQILLAVLIFLPCFLFYIWLYLTSFRYDPTEYRENIAGNVKLTRDEDSGAELDLNIKYPESAFSSNDRVVRQSASLDIVPAEEGIFI